ncbi:MAG: TetR family transcriptional regulator [Gemmataceae bacterium]|nr:TetR family transcriptional regulator [Gemmataceae bacterium]MCI0737914.1 TetR family transcriptional regulator [Gemmataceae bacterium]
MVGSERRHGTEAKSAARMHKAERKRQLLLHAKHMFVTHGFHHATTEKIAQAAGVTEPVLYRHFETKKAMFLEVLQDIRQATLLRWQEETGNIDDPMNKLRAIFEMYLDSSREHAVEMRIMHRTLIEAQDEEIRKTLRAFYADNEQLLAQIIRDGQERGKIRRDLDPRVGAWELIRTALGYTLTQSLDIPLYREPGYVGKAIDCVLACLRT